MRVKQPLKLSIDKATAMEAVCKMFNFDYEQAYSAGGGKETLPHFAEIEFNFEHKDAVAINIPKDKIKGLRFGQLISNALLGSGVSDEEFEARLFYIENDELESIIKTYLGKIND